MIVEGRYRNTLDMSADCRRTKAGRSVLFNYKSKFVHAMGPYGRLCTRLGECSNSRPRQFISGKEPGTLSVEC
jgi:hypothetical protein